MDEQKTEAEEVHLGAQGRLVIPARLRKALDLKPGDRLIARQAGDALLIERAEAVHKRLRDRFRGVPRDVSLVDDLLAERRTEALREEE